MIALLGWRGALMHCRSVVAFVLVIVSVGHGRAEQPSTRIDLSLPRRLQSFYGIVFGFTGRNLKCPEDRRTIAVSKGVLRIFSLRLPPFEQPIFRSSIKADPLDDVTYRYQFAKAACRTDIDIRDQVRVGEQWQSLLVREDRRPSLPPDMRQEAAEKRIADLLKKAEAEAKENPMSDVDIVGTIGGTGPRRWTGTTTGLAFPFDEAPQPCMDVLGEYRIASNSFAMAFFAPLPGELNKFVLEGFDLDQSHARIYLTKDDCRFEFTISQSVMHDGQWTALPLRPAAADNAIKVTEPGP
jgi:hypothetical protein